MNFIDTQAQEVGSQLTNGLNQYNTADEKGSHEMDDFIVDDDTLIRSNNQTTKQSYYDRNRDRCAQPGGIFIRGFNEGLRKAIIRDSHTSAAYERKGYFKGDVYNKPLTMNAEAFLIKYGGSSSNSIISISNNHCRNTTATQGQYNNLTCFHPKGPTTFFNVNVILIFIIAVIIINVTPSTSITHIVFPAGTSSTRNDDGTFGSALGLSVSDFFILQLCTESVCCQTFLFCKCARNLDLDFFLPALLKSGSNGHCRHHLCHHHLILVQLLIEY